MAIQGKVAPGKRGEDIGVIDLGIFDIAHFGNLSRGDSQMVDSLVEALGLKIGLSNGKVRRDQSEVWFSMGEDQYFGQGQLVQPYLQGLFCRLYMHVLQDGLH